MDYEPLRDTIQGALWRREKRFVLLISNGKIPKELRKHPRIKVARAPPQVQDPLLADIALLIFVKPYKQMETSEFCRAIRQDKEKAVKILVWDQIIATLEPALLRSLWKNPLEGEEPIKPSNEVLTRFAGKPRECTHGSHFAWGEFTEFVRTNAKPDQESKAADIERIWGLIEDGPDKPSKVAIATVYYKLAAAGKIKKRVLKTA
ncbi:MAG: hypothetical protein Q7R62_00745 [bacterium]|nr:hypothetical protein [bacterium]